uniref:CSON012155 protein n=1 Tax=Culicoides sonorensis TaxID=179676 RepID=A0A336KLL4_CULSO
MMALKAAVLFACIVLALGGSPIIRPGTGNPSPRLPRTSASQQQHLLNGTGSRNLTAKTFNNNAARPRTRHQNTRTIQKK